MKCPIRTQTVAKLTTKMELSMSIGMDLFLIVKEVNRTAIHEVIRAQSSMRVEEFIGSRARKKQEKTWPPYPFASRIILPNRIGPRAANRSRFRPSCARGLSGETSLAVDPYCTSPGSCIGH